MKNVLLCFVLLTGCNSLKIPYAEECWNSVEDEGLLLCRDDRLPSSERVYTRRLGRDINGNRIEDVVTNSDDYIRLRTDYIETKRKLEVCKKNPRNCK